MSSSWEPTFEDDLSTPNGLTTFEHYSQQEDYGLRIVRPRHVALDVDEEVYDNQTDTTNLSVDARAQLELQAYYRKLGNPKKKSEIKKWNGQQEDGDESEISEVIRVSGLEREPPSNYRPNSKTTFKTAISLDKIPVSGVKGLYLSEDHFKFQNPYVRTPLKPKPSVEETEKSGSGGSEISTTSTSASSHTNEECSLYRKSFKESNVGVAGEQYVSPAQLYAIKARRNR